ncbi:MAG: co-chaperone GroES [Nitrososphaerales archaeon]
MNLRLLGDLVLINPIDPGTTKGGLIISAENKSDPHQKGEIVGVGTGRITIQGTEIPLRVKVGDIVLFRKAIMDAYFDENNNKSFIMPESNIIGVVSCYNK